jgi:hypothetical protein
MDTCYMQQGYISSTLLLVQRFGSYSSEYAVLKPAGRVDAEKARACSTFEWKMFASQAMKLLKVQNLEDISNRLLSTILGELQGVRST